MHNKIYLIKEKRSFPRLTGVYQIGFLNSNSGKIYVGSASSNRKFASNCGFKNRWLRHIRDLKNGTHHSITLLRAYQKYGEKNLYFKILELVEPKFCLNIEQKYIDLLDSCNNGYNVTPYAKSSTSVIDITKYNETLKLIYLNKNSKILCDLENLYKVNKNIKELSTILNLHTCTIRHMLKILGIYSKTKRKIVYQYDLNGNLLNQWNNMTQCRKGLNISSDSVRRVLTGKGIQSFGFFFSYNLLTMQEVIDEYNKRLSISKINKSKSAKKRSSSEKMKEISLMCDKQKKCIKNIHQYDLQNNIIKIWKDSNEIEQSFGKNYKKGVLSCARGHQKTHDGFKWSIENIQ